MITTVIVQLAYFVLSTIVNILPAGGTLPSAAHSAAVTIGGYVGISAYILPYGTLLTVVSFVLVAEIGLYTFRNFKWVISFIPFVGGRG